MALTSNVDRSPEEMNACLERRMETLVSDLQIIEGMTRRGAVLPEGYRRNQLQAIWRYSEDIYHALARGQATECEWQRKCEWHVEEQADAS